MFGTSASAQESKVPMARRPSALPAGRKGDDDRGMSEPRMSGRGHAGLLGANADPRTAALLAGLIGPCPACGNGRLRVVFDGELTNFLCLECQACWHPERASVRRVDHAVCPGCPSYPRCRPDGDALIAARGHTGRVVI